LSGSHFQASGFAGGHDFGASCIVLLIFAMKHELPEDYSSDMTDQEKKLIKYKKQYLNLVNRIIRLQLAGEDPPKELLKQTQEIGRIAKIPETVLKSILY
jgi:hypothetical protein